MSNSNLKDACARWQSGRDGGSSLLRAAARVLTGTPHYVEASFIAEHDAAAAADPSSLADAGALLEELANADPRSAEAWCEVADLPSAGFAGRGLKSSHEKDDQIEAKLDAGEIRMPLWGLSLDRAVTTQYGGRFLFEMSGPFPAVAAWKESGIKDDEKELISGGVYRVVDVDRSEHGLTVAKLEWSGPLVPQDD